jgi:hypothetical protein
MTDKRLTDEEFAAQQLYRFNLDQDDNAMRLYFSKLSEAGKEEIRAAYRADKKRIYDKGWAKYLGNGGGPKAGPVKKIDGKYPPLPQQSQMTGHSLESCEGHTMADMEALGFGLDDGNYEHELEVKGLRRFQNSRVRV